MPLPGAETKRTVLNVLGGGLQTGRYIDDILGTGKRDVKYYRDNDLQIGCHLNVFGRDVVLTDCDPFTKEYYRKKVCINAFQYYILSNCSNLSSMVLKILHHTIIQPYYQNLKLNMKNVFCRHSMAGVHMKILKAIVYPLSRNHINVILRNSLN